MCGIAALLDPSGHVGADAGARMAAALRHRGPDGEAVRALGPATLVHTRLSIIDVAGGAQPLRSEDGNVTAIVNGEIYNHRELRTELEQQGHEFATGSDCEVVVHLYERDGADCVRALNGIFGLVIWDARTHRLLAARDPFGVKPLYWWSDGRRTAIASEVGALTASGLVSVGVDRVALDHYLACRFVPAPRTLFEGVAKLPAASLLTVGADGATAVTDYREAPGEPLDISDAELERELADRFTDAVARQMMSDVPFGAFLSGGVDSAAVVAAMAKRSAQAPATFTIGFPGHGDELDERDYARQSARLLGSDHADTGMVERDFVPELARCVRHLEEPCGIPSAGALMALSHFAARSVKVVLSGQGADEPHGGYGRHRAAAVLGHAWPLAGGPLARPLVAMLQRRAGDERARRASRLLGPMPDAERLLRLVEITDPPTRRQLVGSDGRGAAAERTQTAAELLAPLAERPPLDRALHLDTHMLLGDGLLICADKMSMSASLEQRVPFLDLELMRFVERIPARQRASVRRGKAAHRAALRRLLPDVLVDRPKHGFSTPYEQWLRGSLGDELTRRYVPGSPLAELVDPSAVASLVESNRRGQRDSKRVLYCLLELSEWHRTFVQGTRSPAPEPVA